MGAGEYLRQGMTHPRLGEPVETDVLARFLPDNPGFWLARRLKAGHNSARVGACNTGICNMEDLVGMMRTGEILFGAMATFESLVNEISIVDFHAQKALADDRSVANLNDHVSLVSRPALTDRSGFVIGEGAGVLLLMNMELALEIGAVIYGEMLSARTAFGSESDSPDAAAPTEGVIDAMRLAIEDRAKLDGISIQQALNQLDVINGHGTSTPAGDINGMHCYDGFLKAHGRDPKRPVAVIYAKGGPRLDGIPSARQAGGNGTGHLLGGAASAAAAENMSILKEGILPAAVSAYSEVDANILESRYLYLTTQPTRLDADEVAAEAEGFDDSNGVAIKRKYRAERYRFGRENAGKQQEAEGWRDEQIAAIKGGTKKPADFLPPIGKRG
jgi:3-oxoacyl-(acyl-carrier-protein) synthase